MYRIYYYFGTVAFLENVFFFQKTINAIDTATFSTEASPRVFRWFFIFSILGGVRGPWGDVG